MSHYAGLQCKEGEVIEIPGAFTTVDYFAVPCYCGHDDCKELKYHNCREVIGKDWAQRSNSKTPYDIFFYGCTRSIGGDGSVMSTYQTFVAQFLRKVEQHLGIAIPSICGPTNVNGMMWFKVSPFWMENALKRSFFTIVIRAAGRAPKEEWQDFLFDFRKAIYRTEYASKTEYATERFLNGYTEWKGSTPNYESGWVQYFETMHYDDVCKRLRHPQERTISGWIDKLKRIIKGDRPEAA